MNVAGQWACCGRGASGASVTDHKAVGGPESGLLGDQRGSEGARAVRDVCAGEMIATE